MEKSKIGDKIYDVVSLDEYIRNQEILDSSFTAVKDGDYLYPIRPKTSNQPGLYSIGNAILEFKDPVSEEDKKEYSVENTINFENAKSLKDIIVKQNKLKKAERTILTTPENIFIPTIGENDSPEMVGLKKAVIAKEIDIDKYQARFGNNYSNDKRLFNDGSITMVKLKTMMKALDMKGTLIIEDLNEDIPNPIGKKIVIDLLGGDDDETK